MRKLWVLSLLAFLLPALLAPDADARRRRRRQKSAGPFPTAVAPFDGDGSGGYAIAESLELELELVETVVIGGDRWLRSDLRKAGDAGYERAGVKRIMKRRKIEILIRGRTRDGELEVYVFGKDGRPRFFETFPEVDDPDDTAREIGRAISPVLKRWSRAKPVSAERRSRRRRVAEREPEPEPEPEEEEEEEEDEEEEVDLFVDFDDDGNEVKRPKRAMDDDDDLPAGDDDDEDRSSSGRRLLLGDSDDDEEEEEEPRKARSRRRSRMTFDDDDDDDDEDEDESRGWGDDAGKPRQTMADVDSDEGASVPSLAWINASAGAQLNFWKYDFKGVNQDHDLVLPFLMNYGGGAHVSVFPIEYVGVEAFASGSFFSVNASGEPVRPSQIDVLGFGGGIGVRARFPFQLGPLTIAPGARLGYRLWAQNVPEQTHAEEDPSRGLTLVPGWTMHAAAIGVDVLLTYVILKKWRVEVEARVDPMPLVFYVESPDNPGNISRPVGGAGSLNVRIPVWDPVYVEVFGQGIGVRTVWEGSGTRVSANDYDADGNRVTVGGGEGLNMMFGGGLAVGVSF